ncbi:MAG TPA: antibiotic biosynthesis monooxygenase [Nitrososphaerales archaeon]|nr:antibiotic biosynthesis monooxygenase [Nitrososphaerales archaeon]
MWRCRTRRGQEGRFLEFLKNHATPILKKQPGCISWLYGRERNNQKNFLIVTVWKDQRSLRKFTGPKWKSARIDPEEKSQLAGMPDVEHYDAVSYK